MLTRIPVDSSMIAAVAYDAENQRLYAEFNSGKIWAYEGVEPDVFERLLKANSIGRFMLDEIIDCYNDYPVRRGRDFKW